MQQQQQEFMRTMQQQQQAFMQQQEEFMQGLLQPPCPAPARMPPPAAHTMAELSGGRHLRPVELLLLPHGRADT